MPKKHSKKPKTRAERLVRKQRLSKSLSAIILVEIALLIWLGGSYWWGVRAKHEVKTSTDVATKQEDTKSKVGGKIINTEQPIIYSTDETRALIAQANKNFTAKVDYSVTKQVFSYSSTDARTGEPITVYGRIYIPSGKIVTDRLPLLAFAPGTTGIGDQCAASLEQPQKANWANYDSLLAAYTSQGYVVVTTDYEGMRDKDRMHHYMVGEQEGRAVLDSVRAAKNLVLARDIIDSTKIALGGYSQGGHAVLWADQIAANYGGDIKPAAVVTFGPVTSVKNNLSDVTKGSNLNWFGPFVLSSYSDYYKQNYPIDEFLTAKYSANLNSDVNAHCIDTLPSFYGHTPTGVYTPAFITAMKSGDFSGDFAQFGKDLDANAAPTGKTASVKLINQGGLDNVILPAQTKAYAHELCSKNPKTTLKVYSSATHYNTMVTSFNDDIIWLNSAFSGQTNGNCS